MNVQKHMSAGQVPNRGGLPQQNGNALPPNQMQNLVGGVAPGAASGGVGVVPQQHNMLNMDFELLRARMLDKIFSILLHRQSQPVDETTRMKFRDISKHLEKGLFKAAHTKEDYMNMETLEPRLSSLIKGRSGNNHNQRHQQLVNSTSSISSMMVPYHLHNPTAPAFVTTCNICHLDIETGQGWRCEVCPDYDVCNTCYQKDGGIDHPHKLTNHPSNADRDAQNKEARQPRVLQLRKMLDLLVHASQCRSPHCQYPNCRKVMKGLYMRHLIQCKTRASGGCFLCKKMWYLLQLHARACKETVCHVPRCRDLKEHLMRRLQQHSDSRQSAAVIRVKPGI